MSKINGAEKIHETNAPETILFEDAALIEQCQRGNPDALARLLGKYQDRLFNVIYRINGNYDDALEITQEAFVRALQNIGKFRQKARFYTWLFRIAVNLAINLRRRSQRVHFGSLDFDDDQTGLGQQAAALTAQLAQQRSGSPSSRLQKRELQQQVLEALAELDEQHRGVVVLKDMEQLDYQQISEILQVPVGTVKSRLHRARMQLKDKLAHLMDEL